MITICTATSADIPVRWKLRTRALREQYAAHYAPGKLRIRAAAPAPATYPALLARGDGLKAHVYASLNAVPFYEAAGYRAMNSTQYQHPSGILPDCVFMTRA